MARYDVVVIGAGLGGLTAGAILARAGRKVLVVERSNSVGGAASSYKSGELFVEGSLHETSDPHDPRDPKHDVLTRAGVIDAVKWIPSGAFYQARGGPIGQPFLMPDDFAAARCALTERFAPTPPPSIWRSPFRTPRTAVPGLYLASAYAGFGGYTGVVQSAGVCADMILREG